MIASGASRGYGLRPARPLLSRPSVGPYRRRDAAVGAVLNEEAGMHVSDKQILDACLPILRKARGEQSGRRPFLTAQQIWISLCQKHNPLCGQLIESCRPPSGMEKPGVLDRLADALADAPYMETCYLDTRYVQFDLMDGRAFGAGGRDCRIFRLL